MRIVHIAAILTLFVSLARLESTDESSEFFDPDPGLIPAFDSLEDGAVSEEKLSDLEAAASERTYNVRDLFKRRRKPLTSKNDTASNILLEKIKNNAKDRAKFDPDSAAALLKNRRRNLAKTRKRFKPVKPKILKDQTEEDDPLWQCSVH